MGAVLKSAYAQFVFMLAGADADQMDRMRAHITALAAGWDVGIRPPNQRPVVPSSPVFV
jgi:hypothetical protein